jgi:NTE family protein
MFHENEKTISGVILSGGGAFGAWEVGVLKALTEGVCPATQGLPMDPQVFSGTSVGSFNAAVMAMHHGNSADAARRLEEIWLREVADCGDGRGNGVYRIRANPFSYGESSAAAMEIIDDMAALSGTAFHLVQQFFEEPGSIRHRALGFVDLSAFICVDPFRELLARVVQPEAIRSSPKIWQALATNWEMGAAELFTNEHMTDKDGHERILASAAIPGVFPPVRLNGKIYVDGGVVVNTPITYAIQAGANELHMLDLDPLDEATIPPHKLESTFETFGRVYTAMLAVKIDEDIATIDWLNQGIDLVERVEAGETPSSEKATDLIRVISQIYLRAEQGRPDYKKLTVHRHKPSVSLGGPAGMLNFHKREIESLIASGYEDAKNNHDCERNKCLIPRPTPTIQKPRVLGARYGARTA